MIFDNISISEFTNVISNARYTVDNDDESETSSGMHTTYNNSSFKFQKGREILASVVTTFRPSGANVIRK